MGEERTKLWRAYINGDKEALGTLYTYYHPELILFLNKRLKDTCLAEDLASHIIERLLRKSDPENIIDFEAYLFGAAIHACNAHFRRKGKEVAYKELTYARFQVSDAEEVFAKESIELGLQPAGQEIWRLLNQGFWLEYIAQKIGKSVKTVYHTTTYIKKKLKGKL